MTVRINFSALFLILSLTLASCGSSDDDELDLDPFVGNGAGGVGGGGGSVASRDASGCFDRDDTRVTERGSDDEACSASFACASGEVRFDDPCGCGCATRALVCPPAAGQRYIEVDPDQCSAESASRCRDDETYFANACGCGCEEDASAGGGGGGGSSSDPCDGLNTFNEFEPAAGFEEGALCGSYVVCADRLLSGDDIATLLSSDVIVSCDFAGVVNSCPPATDLLCVGFADIIRASERERLCTAVAEVGVDTVGCAPVQ